MPSITNSRANITNITITNITNSLAHSLTNSPNSPPGGLSAFGGLAQGLFVLTPSVRASPECIPPHGPHRVHSGQFYFVLLVSLLVFLLLLLVNLPIIWNGFASKFTTLFVILFHAIISPDYRFFFQVPRIEELQDPDSSPRREEVGRRTLRDYGGFLLPFFYRDRFRLLTSRFS